MIQSRRRSGAVACLAVLAVLLAGCDAAATVIPVGSGPCTVGLTYLDPEAGPVPLGPPYVVAMNRETPSGVRTAHVEYVATGWKDAQITVETPDGVTFVPAIRWFDRSSFGQGFDRPGVWTVRWSDEAAGCFRELSVLVVA